MQDQNKTAAMVITRNGDGFTVLDACGKMHTASSVEELGVICAEVVDDPTLPEYETAASQTDKLGDVAEEVARSVLPDKLEGLAPLAGPAVHAVKEAVSRLQVNLRTATPSRHTRSTKSTPESRAEGRVRTDARMREKERLKRESKAASEASRRAERVKVRSLRI